MQKDINDRVIVFAKYIISKGATVRQTGARFGYGKSTVHFDVTERLSKINYILYKKVKKIMENNFRIKHIRGGLSTKKLYNNKKIIKNHKKS